MDMHLEDEPTLTAKQGYQLALSALGSLPDHCAMDIGELADRIGADKLQLIIWVRADIKFARLLASKVIKE